MGREVMKEGKGRDKEGKEGRRGLEGEKGRR